MNLSKAELGREYIVRRIETDDEELNAFLFSLGCYSGEPITVVSRRWSSCPSRMAVTVSTRLWLRQL